MRLCLCVCVSASASVSLRLRHAHKFGVVCVVVPLTIDGDARALSRSRLWRDGPNDGEHEATHRDRHAVLDGAGSDSSAYRFMRVCVKCILCSFSLSLCIR